MQFMLLVFILEMDEGNYYTYSAYVEPENATNKEIKWSSSDESKATINSEGIHAYPRIHSQGRMITKTKSSGYVEITATSVDNPDAKATATVHIRPKPSTFAINKTTAYIIKGSTEKLTVTVEPGYGNLDINWFSFDETVATVGYTSGIVTARSAGKTKIRAVPTDGVGIHADCEVTVTDPTASITLNKTGTVNTNTGDTLQLTATVKPDIDVYKNIQWSSNDPTIADVSSSGLVSFKKAGTAIISAVSAFDPSIVAKVTFNVTDAQATQ